MPILVYLPANITPPSFFCSNFIIAILEIHCHSVGHYGEDIKCRILFHGFFFYDYPALMLVKAIPLEDL